MCWYKKRAWIVLLWRSNCWPALAVCPWLNSHWGTSLEHRDTLPCGPWKREHDNWTLFAEYSIQLRYTTSYRIKLIPLGFGSEIWKTTSYTSTPLRRTVKMRSVIWESMTQVNVPPLCIRQICPRSNYRRPHATDIHSSGDFQFDFLAWRTYNSDRDISRLQIRILRHVPMPR
jgi:hypothetical protein